jgi:hypothetical protein
MIILFKHVLFLFLFVIRNQGGSQTTPKIREYIKRSHSKHTNFSLESRRVKTKPWRIFRRQESRDFNNETWSCSNPYSDVSCLASRYYLKISYISDHSKVKALVNKFQTFVHYVTMQLGKPVLFSLEDKFATNKFYFLNRIVHRGNRCHSCIWSESKIATSWNESVVGKSRSSFSWLHENWRNSDHNGRRW